MSFRPSAWCHDKVFVCVSKLFRFGMKCVCNVLVLWEVFGSKCIQLSAYHYAMCHCFFRAWTKRSSWVCNGSDPILFRCQFRGTCPHFSLKMTLSSLIRRLILSLGFVVVMCVNCRAVGSIVVLLYRPCTLLFSKGFSSFVSLNVYMPWDPLKGDVGHTGLGPVLIPTRRWVLVLVYLNVVDK